MTTMPPAWAAAPAGTWLYGGHVRANGIRQHYLRFGGRGPALLLVPGIVSPAALWAVVAQRLGRTFDTWVLDVRGRGLSQSGPELAYDLDTYAADVTAFAQAAGLDSYVLLGHSMGARIGIRAARLDPSRIAHLLLVDPPVSGPGRRPYPSPLSTLLELLKLAREGHADRIFEHPSSAHWPEAQRRLRAEWLHTCDERAAIVSHQAFQTDDIHADLAALTLPMSLIAAGKGDVIRPEEERELRALCPRMGFTRVAGAGHQIQMEDFEGFFAAVGAMLGRPL